MAEEANSVAIYAAALSTIVAAWNFYQWWTKGPKLKGYTSSNMSVMGGVLKDDNTYIVLTVSNRGDAATTVTNLGLLSYTSWFRYIRGKAIQSAIITPGGRLGSSIPSQLAPGNEFRGFAIQDSDIVEWSRKHLLFMCVWHSMANRPYRVRVKPISNAGKPNG